MSAGRRPFPSSKSDYGERWKDIVKKKKGEERFLIGIK
jgi:hypothetical protein